LKAGEDGSGARQQVVVPDGSDGGG